MEIFTAAFVGAVLKIIVIDVVLSGDNAVVIAMAAHRLPPEQRRLALWFGTATAILLRIVFTAIVAWLLWLPFLRLIGGLLLVWIAVKLLLDEHEATHNVKAAASMVGAIWTITLADCVMSLDNMLAVGGASEGNLPLLIFGLLASIFIIMRCSALIANWMNRLPILVSIGAAVLGLTAAEMILKDHKVAGLFIHRDWGCYFGGLHNEFEKWLDAATIDSLVDHHHHWIGWLFIVALVALVVAIPPGWNLIMRRPKSTGGMTKLEIPMTKE